MTINRYNPNLDPEVLAQRVQTQRENAIMQSLGVTRAVARGHLAAKERDSRAKKHAMEKKIDVIGNDYFW